MIQNTNFNIISILYKQEIKWHNYIHTYSINTNILFHYIFVLNVYLHDKIKGYIHLWNIICGQTSLSVTWFFLWKHLKIFSRMTVRIAVSVSPVKMSRITIGTISMSSLVFLNWMDKRSNTELEFFYIFLIL